MKLGKGSSALFTIGIAVFHDAAVADACRAGIQTLRRDSGMKLSGVESAFHYCEMGKGHREAFFDTVAGFQFQFFTGTITKERLSGKGWQKKEYMYQRAGILALDQALDELSEAKLLFAATSGRQFDWKFLRFLKKHAGYRDDVQVIKDTHRMEPYKDDLIQLIDMVCGAVLYKDPGYYRLIRHRDGGRVVFPE